MAFTITYDGWIIALVSFGISAMSTLVRNAVLDKEKIKEHKEKIKKHQEDLKEATKKGDAKRAQKIQSDLLEVTMENLKHGMKPMLYTWIPIIVIFGWLSKTYAGVEGVVEIAGWRLGWFGWYFISAIITSIILNKVFKLT